MKGLKSRLSPLNKFKWIRVNWDSSSDYFSSSFKKKAYRKLVKTFIRSPHFIRKSHVSLEHASLVNPIREATFKHSNSSFIQYMRSGRRIILLQTLLWLQKSLWKWTLLGLLASCVLFCSPKILCEVYMDRSLESWEFTVPGSVVNSLENCHTNITELVMVVMPCSLS